MIDITHKSTTLRRAVAGAVVKLSNDAAVEAVKNDTVPKGNVFEMSKAAGLFAVKKTAEMIPDCHPLPVEYTKISHELKGNEIHITIEVATVYKTGVEVEAMHGASVVALTLYDMLKPIDKGIVIGDIRLISKKGGKSDYRKEDLSSLTAAVIVCSDTASQDASADRSGNLLVEALTNLGIGKVEIEIVSDDEEIIQISVKNQTRKGTDIVILTGGTGAGPRDVTPEAILPLLDKRLDGVEETMRRYGQDRMPLAMLSRNVAGLSQNSLILAFPGSKNAVLECFHALFPSVLHVLKVLDKEYKH